MNRRMGGLERNYLRVRRPQAPLAETKAIAGIGGGAKGRIEEFAREGRFTWMTRDYGTRQLPYEERNVSTTPFPLRASAVSGEAATHTTFCLQTRHRHQSSVGVNEGDDTQGCETSNLTERSYRLRTYHTHRADSQHDTNSFRVSRPDQLPGASRMPHTTVLAKPQMSNWPSGCNSRTRTQPHQCDRVEAP